MAAIERTAPLAFHTDVALESDRLRERASNENFPVALRWLPGAIREDLLAVYAAARLIDEAGDTAAGDRTIVLGELERDLDAAFRGQAQHPVLARLTQTIRRRDLEREPFQRLIEANLFDQRNPDLETWDDLLGYCALSANPIGEIVLRIFAVSTPDRIALSNDVCSALQIIEHCQDVAEDARASRIYLPRLDRSAFGCRDEDLVTSPAPVALRRVIAEQVMRARRLLDSGQTLVADLHGAARIAISGFVAGGTAVCESLERAGFDPNGAPTRARRRDVLRGFVRLYLNARRA
jgi:squalene synthase HpnC